MLCHFLVYMAKYPHAKKKSTEYILRKMCHRRMARQTDGQMNRTDFVGCLLFDYVFRKFENKIIWLDCEPYGNNQYKKKEYNQHSSVFKEFKNNYTYQNYVR